jgi:hypothetical protein
MRDVNHNTSKIFLCMSTNFVGRINWWAIGSLWSFPSHSTKVKTNSTVVLWMSGFFREAKNWVYINLVSPEVLLQTKYAFNVINELSQYLRIARATFFNDRFFFLEKYIFGVTLLEITGLKVLRWWCPYHDPMNKNKYGTYFSMNIYSKIEWILY